ncbi:hypothetical protein SRHO_G00173430 [Serrasalmus rhombeus]
MESSDGSSDDGAVKCLALQGGLWLTVEIYMSTELAVPQAVWRTELRPDMIIIRTRAPQMQFDESPFISTISVA